MIVPRYYENLSVLHENTMPARAYYIPASKRMDNLVEHREESDRMQLLNGTWKFQYFNSIYDMSDGTLWEAQTALCFRCKHLSDCAVPVLAADSSRDGRRLS